jgi:hypothetical protein
MAVSPCAAAKSGSSAPSVSPAAARLALLKSRPPRPRLEPGSEPPRDRLAMVCGDRKRGGGPVALKVDLYLFQEGREEGQGTAVVEERTGRGGELILAARGSTVSRMHAPKVPNRRLCR